MNKFNLVYSLLFITSIVLSMDENPLVKQLEKGAETFFTKNYNLQQPDFLIKVFSYNPSEVESLLCKENKSGDYVKELAKRAKNSDIVCSFALWQFYKDELKKPEDIDCNLIYGVNNYYPPAQFEYGKHLMSEKELNKGLFFICAAAWGGIFTTCNKNDYEHVSSRKRYYHLPAVTFLTDYYLTKYPKQEYGWAWYEFEKQLEAKNYEQH